MFGSKPTRAPSRPEASGAAFVLAVRVPAGALPGLAPGVWWGIDHAADEASARQRGYRLIDFVSHLGGEAVLMCLTSGGAGRAADGHVLVRRLTGSRPPDPETVRPVGAARSAEIWARCQDWHASPARFARTSRLRWKEAPPRAAPAPAAPEGPGRAELLAQLRAAEAEVARLRRLLGDA